jgi:hypothetical protein
VTADVPGGRHHVMLRGKGGGGIFFSNAGRRRVSSH